MPKSRISLEASEAELTLGSPFNPGWLISRRAWNSSAPGRNPISGRVRQTDCGKRSEPAPAIFGGGVK